MYQIKTFREDIVYGTGNAGDTLCVEEQFNEWAREQHPQTEVVQIQRAENANEYSSSYILTVLYRFPIFG